MPDFFGDELIEEIRSRIDIVDVISGYVRLQKTGKNFKGLCPFHSEKTPSFTLNPEKGFYYCFGCGAGGDVFNFLMKIENTTFAGAVRLLAEREGIRLPEAPSGVESKEARLRSLIYRANQASAEFFVNQLFSRSGKRAREYLVSRGIDRKTAEAFKLGYAPDSWDALQSHLKSAGFSAEVCLAAGLVLENKRRNSTYDRFRDRLMFPILDPAGKPLAFGGRVLGPGEPKYLNSPETPVFIKGRNLYGLNIAREQMRSLDSAVVVEGYMDVIGLHQAGIGNCVASLGTALTREQAGLLARNASSVVIAYDSDAAGRAATMRGLDVLRDQGLRVSVVSLPSEEDPDSYVRKHGTESFGELVAASEGLVQYKLRAITGGVDLGDPQQKGKVAQKVAELLCSVESAVEREAYVERAAAALDVSHEAIRAEIARYKEKAGRQRRYRHTEGKNSYTNESRRPGSETRGAKLPRVDGPDLAERNFVGMILSDEGALREVEDRLDPEDFANERLRDVVRWLSEPRRSAEPDEIVSATIAELKLRANPPTFDSEIVRACMGKIKESRFKREMDSLEARIDQTIHGGEIKDLVEMLYKFREMLNSVSECM